MRRLLLAAALLPVAVLAASCGGTNPKVEEPVIRNFLRDLGRAVYSNDKDKLAGYVLLTAGQRGNPVGAKDAETPDGRERIREGNRRSLRSIYLDAGILTPEAAKESKAGSVVADEKALDRFDGAVRIRVDGKNATARFDIAGSPKRLAEVVTFHLVKSDTGWRLYDYERETVNR